MSSDICYDRSHRARTRTVPTCRTQVLRAPQVKIKFLSVFGSKQMTIGFPLLILGWKDTDLGDFVRLTKLSELVDDGSSRQSLV